MKIINININRYVAFWMSVKLPLTTQQNRICLSFSSTNECFCYIHGVKILCKSEKWTQETGLLLLTDVPFLEYHSLRQQIMFCYCIKYEYWNCTIKCLIIQTAYVTMTTWLVGEVTEKNCLVNVNQREWSGFRWCFMEVVCAE